MDQFVSIPNIYIGEDATSALTTELWNQKCKSVFIVSDPGVVASGAVERVQVLLKSQKVRSQVFCDVKATPTIENIRAGVKELRRSQANAMVAVGGGSVSDAAKAIGLAFANTDHADIASLEGQPRTRNTPPYLIVVPTTFSPAVTSTDLVVFDRGKSRQFVCRDIHAIPRMVVVLPTCMGTMPPALAAQTALEALTAAIDVVIDYAAISPSETSVSDSVAGNSSFLRKTIFAISTRSVHVLIDSLSEYATSNTLTPEGTIQMSEASLAVGAAQSNCRGGMLQAMARALSAAYEMPYGFACATVLSHIKELSDSLKVVAPNASAAFNTAEIPDVVENLVEQLPLQHFPYVTKDGDAEKLTRHVCDDFFAKEYMQNFACLSENQICTIFRDMLQL